MTCESVAYLVSSHFSYATLAVPNLLRSMRSSGIPSDQIFVIISGCKREFDQRGPDCTFWFVNHESRNFCFYIEAINPIRNESLSRFSHVFCLNDTCMVGDNFYELSRNFDPKYDAVGVNNIGFGFEDRAMSEFGAYKLDYLKSKTDLISSFKNANPIVNLNEEGMMFKLAPDKCFYNDNPSSRGVSGPTDVYGTGTLRITETYHSIDLIHYKANWGQNGPIIIDKI